MDYIIPYLVRVLRPYTGWPVALLVFAAAVSPSIAATGASLRLPTGIILWAGLGGAALGLRAAGPRGAAWRGLYMLAGLALGAALTLDAGGGLPPLSAAWRDLGAAGAFAIERLRGGGPAAPDLLTVRFLRLALPRAWQSLVTAPGAGEAGAALIVATLSLTTTLAGAAALGYACGVGRRPFGWGLLLTLALGVTTILGGAGGAGLVLGMGIILALVALVGHTARERAWDATGTVYSDELRISVLGWSSAIVGAALMIAFLIPTSLPRLPAILGGPGGDLPSGLAAIERRVQRGAAPSVDPGLSELPAVSLGVSLSADPPETVALRVRLGAPLAPSAYPRYWRARVLNVYTGRAWWADARVGPLTPPDTGAAPPEGAVVQEIELVARDAPTLVALPDVISIDVPFRGERLADGTLTALAGEAPAGRYRVVSRFQELAPPPTTPDGVPDGPAPGQDSLGLPSTVPPRVRDLARSVAGEAKGQLEQAIAIEAYLRGLPYAYEVQPIPGGGDAVDQFLFDMRQGYCTYYASAMAVMARSLSIPARVAVGYATGTYDEALGAYVVREADAHAWPELLIDGRWQPFEPTPVRPLPERSRPAPDPSPTPLPAPPEPAAQVGVPAPMLWAGAIALLALAAVGGGLLWRARRLSPLARAQLRLERFGTRAGVPWPTGATLHEYGRLLATRGLGGDALAELVALIEAARYAGQPLTPDQQRRLGEAARGLGAGRQGK